MESKGPRCFLTVAHLEERLEERLDDFQRSEWWRNMGVDPKNRVILPPKRMVKIMKTL